jgi:hypothetical protein
MDSFEGRKASFIGKSCFDPKNRRRRGYCRRKPLIVRRLIVPLTLAAFHAGQAFAQGTFPAPLPGQAATTAPVNGAAPIAHVGNPTSFSPDAAGLTEDCRKGLLPLREEAEKRGELIKAASAFHAPPDEACKLIVNFGMAEIKMLKYVETHVAQCGISQQVLDQLKTGHKNTETMLRKVCAAAQRKVPPAGPVGDFDVVR